MPSGRTERGMRATPPTVASRALEKPPVDQAFHSFHTRTRPQPPRPGPGPGRGCGGRGRGPRRRRRGCRGPCWVDHRRDSAACAPCAVKAHGSELEYSMRGNADLAAWGRRALAGVRVVFVGSDHIARVLTEVVGAVDNVRRVPPGVDVDEFHPEDRALALRALLEECRRDPANPGGTHERLPDPRNADKLAAFFATEEPSVLYFGKLLYNKGVHLLFEAVERVGARAVIVGFGDYRAQLETQAPANALFTGPLEHRHLVHLIPLCDVAVVPSIFPEAFGMVAAEAAAAGPPPLVARHSGLAEVAAAIEAEYPPERTGLASFTTGDAADLAAKLSTLLGLAADERRELGLAARRAGLARFSWPAVA